MKIKTIIILILVNLLYASVTLFTKSASMYPQLSLPYILFLCGAVGVLGVYAIAWQQVLKKIDLSFAYMFKATSVVFVLIISCLIFNEEFTLNNIIGSLLLIIGITMYSYKPAQKS